MDVAADPSQLPCNVLGRQNKIDASTANRIPRHVMVFRGLLVLREGDPAGNLDGNAPLRPIRSGARQDNSNGLIAPVACQ